MKKKAWIPGGRGMLGQRLVKDASTDVGLKGAWEVVVTGRDRVDVTDRAAVLAFVADERPALIINATGYTAVDKAESEPDVARAGNALAPGYLGEAAMQVGARALHVSTDYVFDGTGDQALRPEDKTGPVSAYGKSKAEGEQRFLEATRGGGLVVRTSWLYGPGGKNFVTTMLKLMAEREELKVVGDQRGRPTSTTTLSQRLWAFSTADLKGSSIRCVTHVADEAGPTGISWHDFAVAIQRGAIARGMPMKAQRLLAIPTSAYPTPAVRPAWSVLDCSATEAVTGPLPSWTSMLDAYLDELRAV